MTTFYKEAAEALDYTMQWDHVLGSGEVITASSWFVPSPLVKGSDSFTSITATVFISGGVAGQSYEVTNHIHTSGLRQFDQSFIILVNPIIETSGVAAFNVTRNDIILMALEDIKVYAPDFESPPPAAITRASKRLNAMIKAMQATGVGLWLNTVYTQVLQAGAQSYILGPLSYPTPIPRPLGVVEARLVDSSGNEQIMTIMSRDEYMTLPLKSSTGKPNQFYYDPQLTNGVLYVWPVGDTLTDVIKMTLRTPIQDFVNTDDAPDFPVEWADALHYSLAMRLAPLYDVPDRIFAKVQQLAAITLQDADGFDREQGVAMMITPVFDMW